MIDPPPKGLDTQVVGRGLIARTFLQDLGVLNKGFVIFASGVSNSGETRPAEFSREKTLIDYWLKRLDGRIFIYFSTCSVYGKYNNYVDHKLKIEELIRDSKGVGHIYRLSQVVGVAKNTTLVPFFTQQALNHASVDIFAGAARNLLSISDVVRLVKLVSPMRGEEPFSMNLASYHSTTAINIYKRITELCDKPFKARLVDGGDNQIVPIDELYGFLDKGDPLFADDYWKTVLDIWVPRLQQALQQGNCR
jgi:hypothetical protein